MAVQSLAAVADGCFNNVEEATAKIVKKKDTTEPDTGISRKI